MTEEIKTIKDLQDAIKKQENLIKKQRKENSKTFKKMLSQYVGEFFAKNPKVSAFYWTQYTPHFNDGDPCIFSAYVYDEDCFSLKIGKRWLDTYELNGYVDEKAEEMSNDEYVFLTPEECDSIEKGIQQISIDLSEISSDTFRDAFGDGVKVIVTPNQIDVEYYSHD